MSWPLSISYLNGSIHLECIDTSTSVSMLDVCIPVFFLQFFILYNLERRKKKGFLVRQQPMNGSVMMHAVGEDFADRWRKISEDVCVCVCICWYMQWVRVRTCLYNGVSVYYVYIYVFIYTGGENGAEKGKGRASHREKQQQQQQQQAVGLFIKHEKVTGLSKRNVTKYESLSSSSSSYYYFIFFFIHTWMLATNARAPCVWLPSAYCVYRAFTVCRDRW